MSKITYAPRRNSMDINNQYVYLDGKHAGVIRQKKNGKYQYTPMGQTVGGDEFVSMEGLKQSLESE